MKRLGLLWLFVLIVVSAVGADYDQLTNLPTIYVETVNGRSITSRSTYVLCRLIYVEDGETIVYDSVEIRGRGNSTWGLAKKPYRIKFPEPIRFLGKGRAKARSWTLLANHADKTLIHNALASEAGTFVGQPFTAAARFVDLVLNGTYLGNYQISDQVNVDKKRVNIVEQEDPATEDSNITGGYFIELGGFATSDPVWFNTPRKVPVSIKSPDEEIINSAQKDYIRTYISDYETRLFSADYRDPDGYRAYTDSATLISWYIATEVTANPDGLWSTYAYKDQDDPKLYWGPLWDFDIAFNNCNRIGDVTTRFMTDAGFGSSQAGMWVKRMIKDPWFNWAVNKGWKHFVAAGIEEYLLDCVDSLAILLDESQQLNYQKYRIDQHVYNEIYLYSTYQEYIDDLKEWITDHSHFLTAGFASRVSGEEPLDPFRPTEGWYYRITNRGTGMSIDVDDVVGGVVTWQTDATHETQHWVMHRIGKYFQMLNRSDGRALADPSPSDETGTQLCVIQADDTDPRQLWNIVTVNENGNYNLINVATGHAANNQGGGTTNGTKIISYTSDDRNATSNNRQWRFSKEEEIADYIHEEVRNNFITALTDTEKFLNELTPEMVGARGGLYPTDAVEELRATYAEALILDSKFEDDYIQMTVRLLNLLKKASTLNPITKIQQRLADAMAEADSILSVIEPEWMSEQPLMYSREAYEALRLLLEEIKRVEPYYSDESGKPYADSLAVYNTRAATLNLPDEETGYCLINVSGHYLDATDGVLFADTARTVSPTAWIFTHINRSTNAFYLSTAGEWLFARTSGSGMMGLSSTRRAAYGKFIVEPNGAGTFTLNTIYGLMGANEPITDGTAVSCDAADPTTTTWMLRRAENGSAVIPVPYAPLEYAVKLNTDARILSFTTSDDTDRLKDITAQILTSGGRVLYTFTADHPQSVAELPTGTYILNWITPEGISKSIRFFLHP